MDHAAPCPSIRADHCPLCGQPNACAMAAAQNNGGCADPCWCVNVRFAPELLARVPAAAQRLACICARCAGASADG